MKKVTEAPGAMRFLLLAALAALAFSACRRAELSAVAPAPTPPAAAANANANAPDARIDRPVSEPYKGDLSIFEDPNRARNLQIERVMDILKISEGRTVADLGAGSGWFTVRAAQRVGPKGKVYAVEINEDYLKYIGERARRENLANVATVLGAEDDPRLPAAAVDACLILKTYHEIAEPVKVLSNLKKALRPGALVGIIDRNGKGDDHGLDKEKVIAEAARAGFRLKEEYDFTKADGMDYFLVFEAAK